MAQAELDEVTVPEYRFGADVAPEPTEPPPPRALFRQEAVEHYAGGALRAQVVRITPGWTAWAYRLLLGVLAMGLVFAACVHVTEYAAGPAIVRVEGRTDVTARFAATVATVLARPGQRVAADTPLVQLATDDERLELDRIDEELDLQMLKVLRDPTDAVARQALTALHAQRDLAEARLAQRLVRAPRAGVVSDVRIHPGQRLAAGDLILSLVGADASHTLVAVLPGQYRPMLHAGMRLRLELQGYPYAYQGLVIDAVGDEVVGPGEARRYLGPEAADTLDMSGALVLVQARLPTDEFTLDGRTYAYFDGLHGRAEVAVRSEPLLVSMIPALRSLYRHGR